MQNRFKNKFLVACLAYVLIGLLSICVLSIYWLSPDFIISGHDSGLALDTKEFLKSRLYAWDDHLGFGQDNSILFGSISVHLIDYLLSFLANTHYAGNQAVVFFWLAGLFLSAFVLSLSAGEIFGRPFVFIFPVLATLNFFIFQSIFIFERTKYQLQIATLLLLAIVIKFVDKKITLIPASIMTGMLFFIFNGGGLLGLPLYGGTLTLILTSVVYVSLTGIVEKNFKPLKNLVIFYFLSGIAFLALNSYSLLPFLDTFLSGGYTQLGDSDFILANTEWVKSISIATSFLNLFRFQGVPDWYMAFNLPNPGHSFAGIYINSPLLILYSFLIPMLAFSSFLLSRSNKQIRLLIFIGLLVLISAFFTAGSHKPLGFLYELAYQYIPGFSIFRSPYYKFGGALVIGIALLVSFTLSQLISKFADKIKKPSLKNIFITSLTCAIIFSWGLYHYKLFSLKLFSWQKGYSTRLQIPNYIEDFREWSLKTPLNNERILLIPPLNEDWKNDGYSWGYWSLSTLPYMLTPKNIVANETNLTDEEKGWVNKLYRLIKEKKDKELLNVASRLGIKYFLLRKDVLTDSTWSPTESPGFYEKNLNEISYFEKVQQFDKWILYKVNKDINEKFSPVFNLTALPLKDSYLAREFLKDDQVVFIDKPDDLSGDIKSFISKNTFSLGCESCFLERFENSSYLPDIRILPNSPFYAIKDFGEKADINKATDQQKKVGVYLGSIIRRTAEIKTMLVFGVEEKYMLLNLKTINEYLDDVLSILKKTSDSNEDFTQATTVLTNISSVENNLREYVKSRQFFERGDEFRQEFLSSLLKIYNLKRFYEPIYSRMLELELEKRYQVKNLQGKNFNIFINKASLPADENNLPISPEMVLFNNGKSEVNLEFEDNTVDLLKVKQSVDDFGEGLLILKFKKIPNLFLSKGLSTEQTPAGILGCSSGSFKNFNSAKMYKIKISATSKNQALRLYFIQDTSSLGVPQFLIGSPEVDVFPIYSFEPFVYLYRPSTKASDPRIYICNNNKEIPEIENVEINEIFSPEIVLSQDSIQGTTNNPAISFQKINPVKYEINISNFNAPFILKFNERFHPLWILKGPSGDIRDHFMVDGYSSAWVVKDGGVYILEYEPQRYFNIGEVITAITFLTCSVLLIFYFSKGMNKKNG